MPPKSVKKNHDSDDDDDEKPIAKVRKQQISKVKKEQQSDVDDEELPKKHPTSRLIKPKKQELTFDDKKNVKKNKVEEKGKEEKKKGLRKVYDLPGQKRDPPEEKDPLRIFYQTLHEQIPTSELAAVWMMESGLLPLEEAIEVYERKMKKTKNQRVSTPVKVVSAVKETKTVTVKKKVGTSSQKSSVTKKTTESTTVSKQSKKRKAESSEDDPSSDEDSGDDFAPISSRHAVKKS